MNLTIKFFFEKIPSILIVLIPVFLITGPFLSDLSVSIVAIIFLINIFKNNLFKYFNNYYFKFFILFWFILITSSFLSNNIFLSLKNSFFYIRFGIFALSFWYLLEKNEKLLKYVFFSIIFCFVSLLVDGYVQYIFGKNLFGIKISDINRPSSFFGSELILGSYLSRFFPILFGIFVFLNKKINKKNLYLISIIFIFTEVLIFLSGERSAFFYMNLSTIFIILMIKEYRNYRIVIYIITICCLIVLANFRPQVMQRIVHQTIADFNLKVNKNDNRTYIFSKAHTDLYEAGLNIFFDNKFFGVGPRQFRYECNNYKISSYSCNTHPHNTYIELLSESGIFSFIIVFSVFLLILFSSIKHLFNKMINTKKNPIFNDLEVCLLSAVLISLWPLIPTGSFFNNWLSIIYYYPLGILIWQNSIKK